MDTRNLHLFRNDAYLVLNVQGGGWLAAHAGQPVSLESSNPAWITRSLHVQVLLVASLIFLALKLVLWDIQHGKTSKGSV